MRNDRYGSLDGIKGFALIGIIWYHLSQRSLPGGFIGVDVFFTVSGFLLALSVLREIDRTGRLRLGNFYLRRLSRLWPAMAFMIAGSVSLGLFVNHDILVGVPGKSVSALTFTSNWGEIFSGDSYFAATSPQLLRHLWFVALLAQATLVLPLLTAMLHRIGSTFVQALVPVLLAALSACGMWVLYNPSADPTRVYFGTDTHCFGMLLGVALAFVVRHSEESDAEPRRLFTMVMPWLATGALVVLIMMMPRVGKSGPLMYSIRSASSASGFSRMQTQALMTSVRLCGGIFVAMPTAMPLEPLTSRFGKRDGSTRGSFLDSSKFGSQATVSLSMSRSISLQSFDMRASV